LPLDLLTITLIAVGAIIACVIVVLAMRRRGKKEKISKEALSPPELRGYPFKVVKSVQTEQASHAKDELRILDLEREILSDAIRRLYEAHAEGKITEEERERLGQTYKSRMMVVKDAISKDESLVALHELETMQEDLMKLFSDRFDELTSRIDELRSKTQTGPIKEIAVTPKTAEIEELGSEEKAGGEEKSKRKRKQAPAKASPRTEAEKRIEEIRSEVEKVLDRLGQMEIES
jgi:hypothetical protein